MMTALLQLEVLVESLGIRLAYFAALTSLKVL